MKTMNERQSQYQARNSAALSSRRSKQINDHWNRQYKTYAPTQLCPVVASAVNAMQGCGRNNSHILKVNKNQTKQGTQKIPG